MTLLMRRRSVRRRTAAAVSGPAAVVPNSGDAVSGNASSVVPSTPSGLADEDLRLFFFSISGQTISTPAGVDLRHTEVVASTRRLYVFSQPYDEAGPTPTFTFSAAANYSMAQVGVRKYDAAAPLDITPVVASNATAGITLTAPSVDPTEGGTLLLEFFASINNATTNTLSVPTGMAAVDAQTGTGTTGHSCLLASEQRPTDVATGTRVSTSGESAAWAAVAVVIAPGTAGGTGGGEASSRPYFQAADWLWDPIPASPVLDANSANIVSVLATDSHSLVVDKFAAKVIHPEQVTAQTPRYDVTFLHQTGVSAEHEDWGPDPFGASTMPIPAGTENEIPPGDATWWDGHVTVGDPINDVVLSVWRARYQAGQPNPWDAWWGGKTPLSGDGREPNGTTSTGAGLSRFGAIIRESEVAAGVIEHALFFGSTAVTLRGSNIEGTNFRYPATQTDGRNTGAAAHTIMEGARVQLDPSIDLAAIPGITPIELMIGRALQQYGAYCGDNTTANARMGFVFERKPGSTVYANAGVVDYVDMTHIPWSSLRVLATWNGT